jgi:hypothetical protein
MAESSQGTTPQAIRRGGAGAFEGCQLPPNRYTISRIVFKNENRFNESNIANEEDEKGASVKGLGRPFCRGKAVRQ